MQQAESTDMMHPSTKKFIYIVLAVYLLLSLLMFDPKLFTGGDNAVYLILAESISRGKGYRDLYLPDELPHAQYPFGFPLLLAPFVLLFGTNVVILKFIVVLSGLVALYFMIKICELLFKERGFFLIASYVSIPIMITYNHWILSEMPFVCLSLAAVFLLMKAQEDREYLYYVGFLCGIYAVFIRTAGMGLVLGIIIWLLLKKRYKQSIIFVGMCVVLFVPWQLRNAGVERGGGYLEQLLAKNPYQMELGRIGVPDLVKRMLRNFTYYTFTILPSALLPELKARFLQITAGVLFAVLTITGFAIRVKRRTFLEIYFVLSIIVLLAWPDVWSSDRFLLPVLPIFIIYIYGGVTWLKDKIKFGYLVEVFAAIIIVLNVINIIPTVRQSLALNTAYVKGDAYAGYSPDWRRYFEIVEWSETHIPSGNVIMARKPEFVYLLSGHKSIIYPFTTDHTQVQEAIDGCDYIILDNFYWTATTRRYLLPVLVENPEKYTIIRKTEKPEFYLLKIGVDS